MCPAPEQREAAELARVANDERYVYTRLQKQPVKTRQ